PRGGAGCPARGRLGRLRRGAEASRGRHRPHAERRTMNGTGSRTGDAVKERVRPEEREPPLYKVLLLNDDYTTMDFVVHVLETVFQKSPAEAYRIMMHVHVHGRGLAGIYPWEVAETKVETVIRMAREAGFPLKAVAEEACTDDGGCPSSKWVLRL